MRSILSSLALGTLLIALSQAWGQVPTGRHAESARLFRQAFDALSNQDYETARKGFEAGLKLNTDDVNAWLYYNVVVDVVFQGSNKQGHEEWEVITSEIKRRIDQLKPTDAQLTAVLEHFYRKYDDDLVSLPFRLADLKGKAICGAFLNDYMSAFLRKSGATIFSGALGPGPAPCQIVAVIGLDR